MRADYPPIDRLLHRVALGSDATAEMLHDIERKLYLKDAPADRGNHVFVTGLARAGTTVLVRELHATGHFGSLRYADMPLVLAPNLWARLSRGTRKDFAPVERAHGDGIAVNLASPEALDEVYWRVFDGEAYITKDALLPHQPRARRIAGYRDAIRLILRHTGQERYLAKGNNNILRLGTLAPAMTDSTFLLVIRSPQVHARSLFDQHRRFSHGDDRFQRAYMRWLVHHEFGIDHRPFRFPGAPEGDPSQPDYWLATWTACYAALEAVVDANPNIRVVPYEALCSTESVWTGICERLGIPPSPPGEIAAGSGKQVEVVDAGLAASAAALHSRYVDRARSHIGAVG